MKRFWSIAIFTTFSFSTIWAFQMPCDNFDFNIGEDAVLCTAETIPINVSFGAPLLSVQWTPAGLFSNPNSLTTNVTISETTTLQATIIVLSDENLVVNGDFEQGDQDFTSEYIYGTGGGVGLLSNEGQYAIAANAGTTHDHFDNCSDHTGGGNMMVINASGVANSLWCQEITVTPDTDYEFSTWITSVTSENPAQLQFSINGIPFGDVFTASSTTCLWQEFSETWSAGAATIAEICIDNVNLTPNGNDFAIDDISFSPVCVLEDEMTITLNPIDVTWFAIADVCEGSDLFEPNGLLSNTSTPGGVWTVDGTPVDGDVAISLSVGSYEFTYSVDDGECSDAESHFIVIDATTSTGTPEEAVAFCEGGDIVNLFDLLTDEDAGGSWAQISGPVISAGALDSDAGIFDMSNEIAGSYGFEYGFDITFECREMPSVVLVEILPSPVADAGADQVIGCQDATVRLGGVTTSIGLNFTYQWTNLTTMEVVGNEAFLDVMEVGSYELQVQDTGANCIATDQVLVQSNIHELLLSAHAEALGCKGQENGQIIVDEVMGGEAPYLFSINGNDFVDTQTFTDLTGGDYTLTVMDVTGCTASVELSLVFPAELIVVINNSVGDEEPHVVLGDSIRLMLFTNYDTMDIVSILWTPLILNCNSCTDFVIKPTESTTYSATVLNTNGCSTTAVISIVVEEVDDIFIPNAFSPNDDGINDIFYINTGISVVEIESFFIANRWGDILFTKKNIAPNTDKNGWNGTMNGKPANPDTYVYSARLKLLSGKSVLQTGTVILIR